MLINYIFISVPDYVLRWAKTRRTVDTKNIFPEPLLAIVDPFINFCVRADIIFPLSQALCL
jgi:hypothetical protein